MENSEASLFGKKDIMTILNKESDFALRFLRFAKTMGFGIRLERNTTLSGMNLKKF